MDQLELDYFKNILENWLVELRFHAEDTVGGLREIDLSIPDPLDRASFDTQYSFNLRIRDRESFLIKKIKQSLIDIEEDEYGICQKCGRDISIARLKARPVARHCIACKTKMENKERLTGT